MLEFSHVPVLLEQCIEGLAIDPAGTYLDGTAGGAGHSREIAKRLTTGRLISLDQDPDAIQTATERLQGLPAQVVQVNFRQAKQALAQLGIQQINGALLDLGVSSHQLDDGDRGFSYHMDAPLDMRMSQSGQTAADLVAVLSREELARILRDYGEEPYAWQIAGRIVKEREQKPINHAAAGRAGCLCCAARRTPQKQKSGPAHISGAAHCRKQRAGCLKRGHGRHF